MHDHADHIFERTAIGVKQGNVLSGSVLQLPIVPRFMYIPVSHTNVQSIKNTIGLVVNHLMGMGL